MGAPQIYGFLPSAHDNPASLPKAILKNLDKKSGSEIAGDGCWELPAPADLATSGPSAHKILPALGTSGNWNLLVTLQPEKESPALLQTHFAFFPIIF